MPTRPLSHSQRLRQQTGTARDYRGEDARRLSDPALAEAKRIRSTARWRKVRALVLAQQPLCADIYGVHAQTGRVEPSREVDHIIPLRQRPDLAYTESNLSALCAGCHARKSGSERSKR